MYLALGEPMQKRNYYRAGWLRFTDETDMEKAVADLSERKVCLRVANFLANNTVQIDGFKLHVSQSTRPFLTRIKNTPECASRPERIAKDLENAKLLVAKLEDEAAALRRWKDNPLPAANGNGEDANVKTEDVQMTEAETEQEPSERGSEAVERRAATLAAELPKPEEGDADAQAAYETQKVHAHLVARSAHHVDTFRFCARPVKAAIALDLYLAYLRAAYNTCYYCVAIVDHVEELHRKCAGHRRKPLSAKPEPPAPAAPAAALEEGENKESGRERERDGRNWQDKSGRSLARSRRRRSNPPLDEQWIERLDMRMATLINREKVDPKDYGGKDPDE